MRARLDSMAPGMEFHFLCVPHMADRMNEIIPESGGEITKRDNRTYGVVLSVRKCL
ncbi:MAG: hypothetical protein KAR01_06955 [Desulfocapsa sp.]|nr:hypothetical protein [Desulfocapsa sp.]